MFQLLFILFVMILHARINIYENSNLKSFN